MCGLKLTYRIKVRFAFVTLVTFVSGPTLHWNLTPGKLLSAECLEKSPTILEPSHVGKVLTGW